MLRRSVGFIGLMGALAGCGPSYDTILRHGTVYDGTGAAPVTADVAIKGDTVAAIGDLSKARGKVELDVTGLAVTPGFINMLSWATETLIEDGKSQGDIRQGVTLEIMGEGESMGPLVRLAQGVQQGQPGRYQVRHSMDHAARIPGFPAAQRHRHERGILCGGYDNPGKRDRLRRPSPDRGRAGLNARAGEAGDGGGCLRYRFLAHLRPGLLRQHRRAGRALQGRRGIRRDVHQPHAERRQPAARSGG